ncbi:MAG: EI24 domain-containing protein [Alphaproteobacteria bacterium]|nr:EI24 domain-containing protein [Alphaproteobacteria bacterium]
MIPDLFKACAQLSDRRFRRVVLLSCLLAALLLVGLVAGVGWALGGLTGTGWLDLAAGLAGGAAALAAGVILFPAAAAALQGLFLEHAASAVEARYYPELEPPRAQGWGETLRQTAFFSGAALAVNLLLLPVWLFVPPLGLLLFWLANGWLCGREYFEAAALRRLEPEAARTLRRRYRYRIWLAGAAIAWLMTVPVANLAAPAIGTALMLHRFECLRRL